MTVTDCPAPPQVKINVLVAVKGPTVSLPAVALVPDQASEAVHELALVDDHVRNEEPL